MSYIDFGYDSLLTKSTINTDLFENGINSENVDALVATSSIGFSKTTMGVLETNQNMESSNFVTTSAGWQIKGNGDVEFNSGTFRGSLVAGSIDIPDTTTANSFHVDTSGNTWWGATAIGSATAKVLNTGAATFTSITITGGSVDWSTINDNDGNKPESNADKTSENQADVNTSNVVNGAGWTDNTVANTKKTTFFQAGIPTSLAINDLWIDTDDKNKIYYAASSGATTIAVGKWVIARDTDISQAISDAATAQGAANSAQGTADIRITTFYQDSIPTSLAAGDLWVDTNDGNKMYRATGVGDDQVTAGEWVTVRDTDIAQAISDASGAQGTADGKVTTFYQDAAPTATAIGDLWIDTNDGNKLYRTTATGSASWVEVQDDDIATAITNAGIAQSTADSKIVTFYQSAVPTATDVGDIFHNTDDGKTYRSTNIGDDQIIAGEWERIDTGLYPALVDALQTTNAPAVAGATDDTAANAAQGTANIRVTTFYQSAVPASLAAGDFFFDTDDGKMYRATGIGDTTIEAGKWIRVDTGLYPRLVDALQTTNAPAAAGADVTSQHQIFDTTVGGGSSPYATVKAAVDAGKINILILGDTTETADIAVPSGGIAITIDKGITLDMGDYQFTYSEAADVVIQGSGILKYTFTTEKDLFDNASYPTSVLDIKDITIDNQSTAVSNLSDDGVIIKADNIIFLCPDTLFSTINLDNPESVLSNSKIVGRAGGSCLSYGGNYLQGKVNNVLYTGPFIFLIAIGSKATVNNIIINSTSSQATVDVEGGGQLSNMVSVGSSQVDLEVDDGSCVTNINLDGGNVQANMNEPTDKTSIISNLYTTGNIINNSYNAIISNSHFGRVSSSTSSNLILNGVDFTGNVTITGDKNRFVNCTIRGAVSDAGDDNSWIGCQVGADAGGGSNTITITAAANRTIVDGTRTDAAISDAGSGTVLGDNVVY